MKKQLIKTSIKGLFLTTDGKAWHKSANREIVPSEKGIIRFDGKKYNLKKLVIEPETKQPNNKPQPKKRILVADIIKQGYRKTTVKGLYLTKNGKGYNSITKHYLSPTSKGLILVNGKGHNLPKLILQTFKKEPIRSGKIVFKNGIETDFYIENLEYKRPTLLIVSPTESELIQCIRLYFSIENGFNRNSLFFKYYLSEIAKIRGFNRNTTDFILFSEWITPFYISGSQSKQAISKKHGYTILNGTNIINGYLLQLVTECLQDFEKGYLQLKGFLPKPPRKKSNAQILKEFKKSFEHLDINKI